MFYLLFVENSDYCADADVKFFNTRNDAVNTMKEQYKTHVDIVGVPDEVDDEHYVSFVTADDDHSITVGITIVDGIDRFRWEVGEVVPYEPDAAITDVQSEEEPEVDDESFPPNDEPELSTFVDSETVMRLESSWLRVDWANIGEGYHGDFDKDDENDEPLLRYYAYYRQEPGDEFMEVEDFSCCTMISANTSHAILERALRFIYRLLAESLSGRIRGVKCRSPREITDNLGLSWMTADMFVYSSLAKQGNILDEIEETIQGDLPALWARWKCSFGEIREKVEREIKDDIQAIIDHRVYHFLCDAEFVPFLLRYFSEDDLNALGFGDFIKGAKSDYSPYDNASVYDAEDDFNEDGEAED